MSTTKARRRPVVNPHYVWCDFHGCIHGNEPDPYDEGIMDDGSPLVTGCTPHHRPVYVMGEAGESF